MRIRVERFLNKSSTFQQGIIPRWKIFSDHSSPQQSCGVFWKVLDKYFLSILILSFFSTVSIFLDIARSEETKFLKEGKKGHPKVESALLDLQEKYFAQGRGMTQEFAKRHDIRMDEQDKVIVFIQPEAGKTKEAIDVETLKAFGCEIIKSGDVVIKAKVPILMVDLIADHVEGVSFIKLPDRPLADVVSQGVNLTGASSYHPSGIEGQNIKAAIIDLGFAGLAAAIASGELPSSVIKIDCTGTECVSTDFPSETEEHGTAVAEIIHDIAPGAELYLIKVEDRLDLKDAKDFCIANGIKVINHSVGWFNTNFYDGACYYDNPVCTANHAYKNGILWVNSAGNHARKHYGAVFTDRDGDRLHNVTNDSNYISINAQAGSAIITKLTWNGWPETDQDYDLLLYDSSMVLVAASLNWQSGTQPPTEDIFYPVPTSGTFYLAVRKYNATSNHKFEIFTFYHDLNPYVASSSLLSPSDGTDVMAVAAIDQANWTTGPQENFSSQGPTTDGRMKPEVSGPDAVSNYTYGNFTGTSAAAPHVAGVAALVLSSNPTFTVSQLWNAIVWSAIDMGANGQDSIYGYGRLNLPLLAPSISILPSSVDFGNVIVGATSERLMTIQNDGNANLMIGTISSPSAPYQISGDDCSGKTLTFGTGCTLTIRFSPTSAGSFNGSFSIPSNDPYKNPFVNYLSGTGLYEISLSSPSDQVSSDACSLYSPPTFRWSARVSFGSYEIQFSGDPTFSTIPVKIGASGKLTEKSVILYQWKRILLIPGASGGTVYWRIIGSRSDGTFGTSDTRSMIISGPQPVGNPLLSPVSRGSLPLMTWENRCNIRFRVRFGSDPSFSKKRILTYYISDPNSNGGTFSKELTQSQWLAIRRLVGDMSGETIYWYVESWDGLNRSAVTEVMDFSLED